MSNYFKHIDYNKTRIGFFLHGKNIFFVCQKILHEKSITKLRQAPTPGSWEAWLSIIGHPEILAWEAEGTLAKADKFCSQLFFTTFLTNVNEY